MRALRVVGVTGDGSVVLEDPGRRERYTVPADEQLRAAARGDVTRLGQIAIELESQLRPREIQARIRGGASVDQVAAAAGVPVQKIERFAYPVLLERSRTAELAQGAHPQRADGPDIRTLGETVAHTFGLRGQDYTTADWDSWKGDDGKWVVALSWHAGRSDNAAHWAFQPGAHGGTVVALDEHASDLVEGLPARPLRTVGAVVEIGRDDEPEPEQPHEPESPRMRAAGETHSADPRRGIAPEQRRSSPPPPARGAATTAPAPAARTRDEVTTPAYDTPVDEPMTRSAAGSTARTPVAESTGAEDMTAPPETAAPETAAAPPATPGDSRYARSAGDAHSAGDTRSAGHAHSAGDARPAEDTRSAGDAYSAGDARPAGDTRSAGDAYSAGDAGLAGDTRPSGGARSAGDARPGGDAQGDHPAEAAARTGTRATDGTEPGRTAANPAPAGAAEPAASPQDDRSGAAGDPDGEAAEDTAGSDEPGRGRAPSRGAAANRRTKKGKPVMPSWDEVLLGVRGQR